MSKNKLQFWLLKSEPNTWSWDNQVKEGQQIFEAPTLKTDVNVKVQGLISTTTVRQYFIKINYPD